MKSFILLENLEFYAHHGVLEQENQVGNIFVINLKVEIDLKKSSCSDNLDDTISYAEIYKIIESEMKTPSKLIEHAAGRIIRRLKKEHSTILSIEIKLSKRNPPMGSKIDFASVILID